MRTPAVAAAGLLIGVWVYLLALCRVAARGDATTSATPEWRALQSERAAQADASAS